MLKIKDDVDLKELEKYGFEQSLIKETYFKKYEYTSENEECPQYNFELIINPRDSKNKNELVGCFNANDDEIDEVFYLDLLYDLIKDGLVIKE